MTAERGVVVDHSTIHRWQPGCCRCSRTVCRRRKLPVGEAGNTIDFLLRAKRNHAATRAFFERAIDPHGVPAKVTIDKSGSDTAAIVGIQSDSGLPVELCASQST
jgi:transposase-like protein